MSYGITECHDLENWWGVSFFSHQTYARGDYMYLKEPGRESPHNHCYITLIGYPGSVEQFWLDCTLVYHNLDVLMPPVTNV